MRLFPGLAGLHRRHPAAGINVGWQPHFVEVFSDTLKRVFTLTYEGSTVAAVEDNMVLRLLCHLAWLRDSFEGNSNQSTLRWGRRVYNSVTHLQFRFVYPHRSQDRVAEPLQPQLAKALEAVVKAASDAVEPLRTYADAVKEDFLIDSGTAHDLRDALDALLDTANKIGWCGVHAPKEDVRLDRPINPLRLLWKWQRRHRGGKRPGARDASDSTASDENRVELCKGVATKLVVDHSRVMGRVPATASAVLHEVADAHLTVDIDEFGRAGGDQLVQRFAAQMLRDRSGRVR